MKKIKLYISVLILFAVSFTVVADNTLTDDNQFPADTTNFTGKYLQVEVTYKDPDSNSGIEGKTIDFQRYCYKNSGRGYYKNLPCLLNNFASIKTDENGSVTFRVLMKDLNVPATFRFIIKDTAKKNNDQKYEKWKKGQVIIVSQFQYNGNAILEKSEEKPFGYLLNLTIYRDQWETFD